MDRTAAEQIVPMLTLAAAETAKTMDVMNATAPDQEARAYARDVLRVISAIDDLLTPIFAKYPDLQA